MMEDIEPNGFVVEPSYVGLLREYGTRQFRSHSLATEMAPFIRTDYPQVELFRAVRDNVLYYFITGDPVMEELFNNHRATPRTGKTPDDVEINRQYRNMRSALLRVFNTLSNEIYGRPPPLNLPTPPPKPKRTPKSTPKRPPKSPPKSTPVSPPESTPSVAVAVSDAEEDEKDEYFDVPAEVIVVHNECVSIDGVDEMCDADEEKSVDTTEEVLRPAVMYQTRPNRDVTPAVIYCVLDYLEKAKVNVLRVYDPCNSGVIESTVHAKGNMMINYDGDFLNESLIDYVVLICVPPIGYERDFLLRALGKQRPFAMLVPFAVVGDRDVVGDFLCNFHMLVQTPSNAYGSVWLLGFLDLDDDDQFDAKFVFTWSHFEAR
jgi:hypothetical protein